VVFLSSHRKINDGNTNYSTATLTMTTLFDIRSPYNRPRRAQRGGTGIAVLILDLGTRRGGWSAPRPGRLTPGKDPVPILQEAGWAPGLG
jgi:hypothetical protein